MAIKGKPADLHTGSIAAVFLAEGLTKKFSGKGLVSDELLQSPSFTTAVATGAALTSFLATRFGFSVSTTHALVGALLGAGLGAGLADAGEQVHFAALGSSFLGMDASTNINYLTISSFVRN